MALQWPYKDPDELLDYVIDWSARLGEDDSIIGSIWLLPSEPGAVAQDGPAENTASTTTIWLKQGTLGGSYTLTNRIDTLGGRIMDQSVSLKVKTK